MMRHFIGALLALGVLTGAARAEPGLVVVELFTSQGCSSCPPADKLLARLTQYEHVVALSLHIDYWDYIGWTDSFASPAFTARQKSYARASGRTTIYTPQMIIDGDVDVVGHDVMAVMDAIAQRRRMPSRVLLTVERRGETLGIGLTPLVELGTETDVHVVRYRPHGEVSIDRGENAGHQLEYRNIVSNWRTLSWDGAEPAQMVVRLTGSEPAVVLVQQRGYGPILAAARAR